MNDANDSVLSVRIDWRDCCPRQETRPCTIGL